MNVTIDSTYQRKIEKERKKGIERIEEKGAKKGNKMRKSFPGREIQVLAIPGIKTPW